MGRISDLLVGCCLLRLTLAPAEVNRRRFSDSREIKMEPAVRLILVASPLLLVEKSYCPHLCHLLYSYLPGEGKYQTEFNSLSQEG